MHQARIEQSIGSNGFGSQPQRMCRRQLPARLPGGPAVRGEVRAEAPLVVPERRGRRRRILYDARICERRDPEGPRGSALSSFARVPFERSRARDAVAPLALAHEPVAREVRVAARARAFERGRARVSGAAGAVVVVPRRR